LTEEGFEVRTALDANQGYQAAIEATPDLILLDVQLPDVVGLDLIHIIRNRDDLKHVPIIMITGTHGQMANKVKALKDGADDFILKPFEMPELIERVKAVLRRSVGHPSPAPSPLSEGRGTKGEGYGTNPSPMGNLSALNRPAPQVSASSPVDSPPVAAGNGDSSQAISLREAIYRTLVRPRGLAKAALPSVTLPYLSTLLGFSLGGWALSAGSTVKPALIGLGAAGFWGLCVSFLVMACSIMGISLSWKEGARLICLAGLPLLLKLCGGVATTLVTSLSPFYFTASPALFFKSASPLWERLDVFEIWMIWILAILVQQCRGSSKQKAWTAAAIVWPVVAYWQSLWKH